MFTFIFNSILLVSLTITSGHQGSIKKRLLREILKNERYNNGASKRRLVMNDIKTSVSTTQSAGGTASGSVNANSGGSISATAESAGNGGHGKAKVEAIVENKSNAKLKSAADGNSNSNANANVVPITGEVINNAEGSSTGGKAVSSSNVETKNKINAKAEYQVIDQTGNTGGSGGNAFPDGVINVGGGGGSILGASSLASGNAKVEVKVRIIADNNVAATTSAVSSILDSLSPASKTDLKGKIETKDTLKAESNIKTKGGISSLTSDAGVSSGNTIVNHNIVAQANSKSDLNSKVENKDKAKIEVNSEHSGASGTSTITNSGASVDPSGNIDTQLIIGSPVKIKKVIKAEGGPNDNTKSDVNAEINNAGIGVTVEPKIDGSNTVNALGGSGATGGKIDVTYTSKVKDKSSIKGSVVTKGASGIEFANAVDSSGNLMGTATITSQVGGEANKIVTIYTKDGNKIIIKLITIGSATAEVTGDNPVSSLHSGSVTVSANPGGFAKAKLKMIKNGQVIFSDIKSTTNPLPP